MDLRAGAASFTGLVQTVEITRDVAKEKRFLVTINEVSAVRRPLRWDADFLDRLSRDVGRLADASLCDFDDPERAGPKSAKSGNDPALLAAFEPVTPPH